MNVYSPGESFEASLNISGSEFSSPAYLEYRQRVLDQLAVDCQDNIGEKNANKSEEKQNESFKNSPDYSTDFSKKINSDVEAGWDNSDLQINTYKMNGSSSCSSLPHCNEQLLNEREPMLKKTSSFLNNDNANNQNSLTTWSSFNEHIEKVSLGKLDSAKAASFDGYQSLRSSQLSPTFINKSKKQLQRKKFDLKEDMDSLKKSLHATRSERSYSTSSQSLQICYINDCSSSEEDKEIEKTSPKSPSFTSTNGYGQPYIYKKRFSDHSISSIARSTEKTIISTENRKSSIETGSTQNDLEMETRFKLAQAHQNAKLLAEEERKKDKFLKNSSIALRILKVTLPAETNDKLHNFSLERKDCMELRLGQLQLILNDMHSKKQDLSNELVDLLMIREQLKTENEAKIVDIDDIKAIIKAVGPETSV